MRTGRKPGRLAPATGEAARDHRAHPLYLTIAETLQADIAAGRFAVDAMLPTETELCRRFGVSRFTVREALRRLTDIGLVQRRAGLGTIVIASEPPKTFVHRIATLRGMLNYPSDTYRERVWQGAVKVDAQTAEMIGCAPGTEWYCATFVRRTHEARRPIAWANFYVRPEIAARIDIPQIDREPVHLRVARDLGIEVETFSIRIFPRAIRDDLAETLEVAPGTPGLVVVRRYLAEGGRDFAITLTIHPEHRFEFTMDFTRDE